MNSQVWWFVSRSSGIIAWALLTLSVCWGLFISTKAVAKASTPAWLLDLHRFLGGIAVTFTAIHLIGLWADSYVEFGWRELFVPMASEWKPGPVAWGIVSVYLLVAIELTSLAMKFLPRQTVAGRSPSQPSALRDGDLSRRRRRYGQDESDVPTRGARLDQHRDVPGDRVDPGRTSGRGGACECDSPRAGRRRRRGVAGCWNSGP